MKIHSSKITPANIYAAAKARGMVGVEVADLDIRGSRKRSRSFDVRLTGNSPFRPNFGVGDGDEHAAQWDEWGIFINALFEVDPEAILGVYRSYKHFRGVTGGRFDTLTGPQTHRRHKWEPNMDYTANCACGAFQAWGPAAAAFE